MPPPPEFDEMERMSDEEVAALEEELYEWLSEVAPGRAEELRRLREEEPQRYRDAIRFSIRWMRMMRRLQEKDPEAYEAEIRIVRLESRSQELARRYREAHSDEERRQIEQELTGVLNDLFDVREARREREIRQLERHLAEMREQLQRRRQNKTAIVERRLRALTGGLDDLDW
jgi:hypothetical protein